jgi:hypothetical protein
MYAMDAIMHNHHQTQLMTVMIGWSDDDFPTILILGLVLVHISLIFQDVFIVQFWFFTVFPQIVGCPQIYITARPPCTHLYHRFSLSVEWAK